MLKLGILSLSLLSATQGVMATSAPTPPEAVRIIIKYKEPVTSVASLKSQIKQMTQFSVAQVNPMANGAYLLILDAANSSLSQHAGEEDTTSLALERLRKSPHVMYAVRDRISYFKPVPDPEIIDAGNLLSHDSQWDEFTRPAGIMLESKPGSRDGAWFYTTGLAKDPVVVAVLDTGVALNESLIDNLVKDNAGNVWGWNFAANNNNLMDETKSYHGTHVAGTIAGYGQVMSGMGENLKILPLKIPGSHGMFYESSVINAIYWAVGGDVPGVPRNIHPAKVLNMSFGVDKGLNQEIDYCDQALQEAVFFARNHGAVLVAAAGNDNVWEHFNAPAICNGTIKVASTGPEGLRSYFSNYGPSVTLAAPGGDKRYGMWGGILSTVNPGGGYAGSGFDFYQGTSMATPHVAGVAGLIFAASNKALNAEQMEQLLYMTTHDFGISADPNKSCQGKKPCGHGILDAENAVKAATANYDVLFSSPKMEHLAMKTCGDHAFTPAKSRVVVQGLTWELIHAACASIDDLPRPYIEQRKDGTIIAHYGATSYRLTQNAYKECHVIGYDGVGCYL